MNYFADALRDEASVTTTENGARVYSTTGNALLDLFARIGGMRKAEAREVEAAWLRARDYDKELADNLILYTRDVRNGGIGERRLGRIMLKLLALKDPTKVSRNLDTIVKAGRWDDLFVLEGTKVETEMMEYLRKQFRQDIVSMGQKSKDVSLLAKWLPSANTHSKETRRLARKVYTYFGISERVYRKTLSALRAYIDVVEKKMSAQEFGAITYEHVPSVAMTRYRSAFGRHDFERFDEYIKAVTRGDKKINASVSYPYEFVMPYIRRASGWNAKVTVDPVLEAQWKALPNFVEGEHNVVVMADVSGSMTTDNYKPMATSVSLGIYFAERNKGAYKDMLMTFTDTPTLYELNPHETVADRVNKVMSHVGFNTDLDRALAKIYDVASRCGEAPSALVIISDGEIDAYCRQLERYGSCVADIAEKWQRKYAAIGLQAPKLIMWNVESRGARYIAKKKNFGVSYISGSSAATFKELATLISMDAVTAMTEILSKPQFQWH